MRSHSTNSGSGTVCGRVQVKGGEELRPFFGSPSVAKRVFSQSIVNDV
jgi:hypothetical protein